MKTLISLITAGLIASCAASPCPAEPMGNPAQLVNDRAWSDKDKNLGYTALGLTVIDWAQTRYIARNPNDFHEANPMLDKHPSIGRVNTHFAGIIVGGYILADLLPSYRSDILSVYVGIEGINVLRNFSVGVKLSF